MEQCKLLGMDTKGNKPVLVERLIKAREDGHCYLPPELVGAKAAAEPARVATTASFIMVVSAEKSVF